MCLNPSSGTPIADEKQNVSFHSPSTSKPSFFWLNPFDRLDRKEDNASHVRYRTVPELDVWDRRDGIRFPSCRKPIITTHNTTTWHVAMFSNTADWDDV
jgi:hypothetical protein